MCDTDAELKRPFESQDESRMLCQVEGTETNRQK